MTTDTAVRVTRTVVQQKGSNPLAFWSLTRDERGLIRLVVRLEDIPYVDHPELRIDEHESTEMPFRYVKGDDGLPVMPKVCKPTSVMGFIPVR